MRWTITWLTILALPVVGGEAPPAFAGWQDMKVLRIGVHVPALRVVDVDDDGRDEVLVVNRPQARLDIFEWLPRAERVAAPAADDVNALPLAIEFRRSELALPAPPEDAVLVGAGADRRLAVCTVRGRLLLFARRDGAWSLDEERVLLHGGTRPDGPAMLVVTGPQGAEILLACAEGIQAVPLARGARPRWLPPASPLPPLRWSLADLDGDGDEDLVESAGGPQGELRWRMREGADLRPPRRLGETPPRDVAVLRRAQGADLVLLGADDATSLRRCRLGAGASRRFGTGDVLPVVGRGANQSVVGLRVEGQPALLVLDRVQAQMALYLRDAGGWRTGPVFPGLARIQSAVATPDAGGVLLQVDGSADLVRSDATGGRLTFPKAWKPEGAGAGDRLLGLGSAAGTVWWVTAAGDEATLWRWINGSEPKPLRLTQAAVKPAVKALWLGGDRVAVAEAFGRGGAVVARQADGTVTAVPLPAGSDLASLRLLVRNGAPVPARIADGVLQWLGDDLRPVDQAALEPGAKLGDWAELPDGAAWALEAGAGRLHRLAADRGGVLRPVETCAVPPGNALVADPVLGLLLLGDQGVGLLADGAPREALPVATWTDPEAVGGGSGACSRVFAVDLDGDGVDEALVADDRRHRLTALRQSGDGLTRLASWQIFESRAYPYGGMMMGDRMADEAEPRQVAAADVDGDRRRDLILLCHDRLLVYLAATEAAP